ncbi:lipoprotein [Bacteroidia bacterium]|nr:lipoprotein [Bacteroidia bacterium]
MDGELYQVYDEKMIDELMEENHLSDFLAIVKKGGLGGTIHAYGTLTLFAPTNEAVQAYLQNTGKATISDLSEEEAAAIVKYHLVRDTLLTTDFVDGRLPSSNFSRKYLTTKTQSVGADVYIEVNRQARIFTKDVRGSNGYLHIIDNVLTPPAQTVADRIEGLPDAEYSLMKTLFARSGLKDSLSVERTDHWFTFFIQDNQAFKAAGIESIDDLLVQLRENSPAIDKDETLIYNYVAYHGANKLAYIADLLVASDLTTLAPKQVITLKRNLDKILLNEFIQAQTREEGILLDRTSEYSDWSCSNGVIHKIDGNIQIKNRSAYRIYWDIAEQPEIMALKSFRKAGGSGEFASGELADITWGGKTDVKFKYYCNGYSSTFDEKFQYVYGDYLRFMMSTNTMQWVEFKTPVLVPGKYKVWLCYRREHDMTIKSTFKQEGYDDQILPFNFDLAEYMPNPEGEGSSHELIEIEGWKQYNAKKFNSVVISHLLGTIVVETTGRHTLRFEVVSSKHSYEGSWDMIQFIPIDEDQLWPRVDIKGNWFTPDMPACQAWPADCVEEPVE